MTFAVLHASMVRPITLEYIREIPLASRNGTASSPRLADFKQSLTAVIDKTLAYGQITYTKGGRDDWSVVLGTFCGLTPLLSVHNILGVFSAVIAATLLPEGSPSTLGSLFLVYAFVNWVCGVQVGPILDAMGPRTLLPELRSGQPMRKSGHYSEN
jgi:hypothetical protein